MTTDGRGALGAAPGQWPLATRHCRGVNTATPRQQRCVVFASAAPVLVFLPEWPAAGAALGVECPYIMCGPGGGDGCGALPWLRRHADICGRRD